MDTINGEMNRQTRNVTGSITTSSRAQIDPSLTIANMAADAKATGDAIKAVEDSVSGLVNTGVNSHVNAKNNPHNVTKAQVGLSNVDNTSDMNKPVSYAQTAAINEVRSIAVNAQNAGTNALPKSGGTMSGDINMNGKRITGLPTPTQGTDIVTVAYLDEYFLGGEW